jgi:hypothetical protein
VAEASEQKIETRQLSWNKVPDMEEGSIMHGKIAKKGIGSKKFFKTIRKPEKSKMI